MYRGLGPIPTTRRGKREFFVNVLLPLLNFYVILLFNIKLKEEILSN